MAYNLLSPPFFLLVKSTPLSAGAGPPGVLRRPRRGRPLRGVRPRLPPEKQTLLFPMPKAERPATLPHTHNCHHSRGRGALPNASGGRARGRRGGGDQCSARGARAGRARAVPARQRDAEEAAWCARARGAGGGAVDRQGVLPGGVRESFQVRKVIQVRETFQVKLFLRLKPDGVRFDLVALKTLLAVYCAKQQR